MDETAMITLMRESVWTASMVAGPILAVALVTGLAIGLVQALTSIQEMTLTFVPKLLAIAVTFWFSVSYMSQGMVNFFHNAILPRVAGG